MSWEIRLITLFLFVNQNVEEKIPYLCGRLSNNSSPDLTDTEVMVIFLWGIMQKRTDIKGIYNYTNNHLRDWFPDLPSYPAYVMRLNRLADAFVPLMLEIQEHFPFRQLFKKYPFN